MNVTKEFKHNNVFKPYELKIVVNNEKTHNILKRIFGLCVSTPKHIMSYTSLFSESEIRNVLDTVHDIIIEDKPK